jgi:hypothetical protein
MSLDVKEGSACGKSLEYFEHENYMSRAKNYFGSCIHNDQEWRMSGDLCQIGTVEETVL